MKQEQVFQTAFKTSDVVMVYNYPYGFKKTTAIFSIEFKKGKGFRSVFQTINPSNGKHNAPKKGTYHPMLIMKQNEEGFVSYVSYDFNGAKEFNEGCQFMYENFDLFTKEQIQDICAHCFNMLKVTAKAMVIYCGSKLEDIKPLIQSCGNRAIDGFRSGENVFADMILDVEALENTKQKDFNPFRTVQYSFQ
jgi:hypothetical protein